MARKDDGSRWRGWVALAILATLVGLHLWVRSLNAPPAPVSANNAAQKAAPVDPDIDPSLPADVRDRMSRERALRKLLDQQTSDLRAQASSALAAGRHEEAASLYKKVLKIDATNQEAKDGLFRATDERAFLEHFTRGQEALALGDLESALFELEKARALKPNDPDVEVKATDARVALLLRDARRAEAAEDWENAVSSYEQLLALRDDPQLREYLDHLKQTVVAEAVKKAQKRFFERLREAETLESAEKYDDAIAIYDSLIEEAPKRQVDPEKIRKKRELAQLKFGEVEKIYLFWLKKAEELLASGKYAEVGPMVDKALATGFRDPQERALAVLREAKRREIEIDMVEVPAGVCIVGGGTGPFATPERQVSLPRFYIDRNEVSNRQYAAFVQATSHPPPSFWNGKTPPRGMEDVPAVAISYDDALAYATWAGKRLPTEEEWEKAARGTDGRVFPWGNTFDIFRCNSAALGIALPMPSGVFGADDAARTRLQEWFKGARAPMPNKGSFHVGTSPYGICDMAGNAMEWTTAEIAPPDGTRAKTFRILKGGSFLFHESMCRAYARLPENPALRLMGVGFRCVKDPE